MFVEDVVFITFVVPVHIETASHKTGVVVGLLAVGMVVLVVQGVDAPLVVSEYGILGIDDAARCAPIARPPQLQGTNGVLDGRAVPQLDIALGVLPVGILELVGVLVAPHFDALP